MTDPTFTTTVIAGHGVGRLLGFPTLNLVIPPGFTYPHGIYAGWVTIKKKSYMGAFHFGPVPTFSRPEPSLEVFILDTVLSRPPLSLTIQLVKRLRDVKTFPTPQELSHQIQIDADQTKRLLTS